MQGEGKEHEVVRLRLPEVVDVGAVITGSREILCLSPAQSGWSMPAGRPRRPTTSAPIARAIPLPAAGCRPSRWRDRQTQFVVRPKPATQEMSHQTIAAKVTIERAQIPKVRDQFRRNRLRPVHPFRFCGVEAPLQSGKGLWVPIRKRAARDRDTKAPPTFRFMKGTSATIPGARPSPPRSQSGLQTPPGTRCWCRKP